MATYADPVDDTSTEDVKPGIPTSPEKKAPEKTGPATGKRGPLLDLPEAKAAKKAEQEWKKNAWFHKCMAGESLCNALSRAGDRYLRIDRAQDTNTFDIITPLGSENLPPAPNKVEEEIQNVIAIVNSDPFRFDCEPSGDTAKARDAAQFSTRFLETLSSESGLNLDGVIVAADDIAATYSSSFAHVCFDPTASGLTPLTIKARPSATSPQTALTGESPDGRLDTAPFVVKFVTNQGTLSDTPGDAQLVWQGGLKIDLYNSNQVKFLPRQCLGISDAKGVIIATFQTLGDLKRYPVVEEMKPEQLWELVGWKVDDYKRLLPRDFKYTPPEKVDADTDESPPEDDALVCTLTVYYKSHPTYPFGCYAVFGGGKYRLCEDDLMGEVPDAQGRPSKEPLDIPLAQDRWRTSAAAGNPYGSTITPTLRTLDEMRSSIFASAQEYLHRFTKPRMLLPMGTTIQPEDLDNLDTPLYYNPAGKPEWQPIPQYPSMGGEMIDRLDAELTGTSNAQPVALGAAAGSVRSADQQNTLIEQANVGLSSRRDNVADFGERLARIILQTARAKFTDPQLMQYRGEDGAYQAQEFTATSFLDTKVVRVRRGSGTMLAPTAKSDLIFKEQQTGTMTPQEAQRLKRDSIASSIGLQDSPHVLKVKRQLVEWRKGPSEEVTAQSQQFQQEQAMMAEQAAQQQAMTQSQPLPQPSSPPAGGIPSSPQPPQGPPVAVPMSPTAMDSPAPATPPSNPAAAQQPIAPPPPDPLIMAASQIFLLSPVDEEQDVAMLRHQELSRAVAEIDFYGHPPQWKDGLIQAYMQARMASGIQTVAEQQKAMADQQAQAQNAQAAQVQAKQQAEGEGHDQKLEQKDQAFQQKMNHQREAHEMKQAMAS